MPRAHPSALGLLALLAACTTPRQPAAPGRTDTLPAPGRTDTLRAPDRQPVGRGALRPMAAPPAAGISFPAPLADAQVERLLREHRVLPYAVYLGAPGTVGVHEVPVDSASPALIAAARTRTLAGFDEGFCVRRARHLATSEPGGGREWTPEFRDRVRRVALSEFERERRAEQLLRGGGAVIYGLKVTGRSEDVLRLGRDPRVRGLRPAVADAGGEPRVSGPTPPGAVQERGVLPEVEALSAEEVARRLEAILREGASRCRAWDWNAGAGDPPRRLAPGDTVRGLRFRAEVRVVPRRGSLPAGAASGVQTPVGVHATLTVSNVSGRPLETEVRGCTLLLSLYRDAARTRPAWTEGRGGGWACMQAPTRLALAPGESRAYETEADAWRIMGDSLPPGRYPVSLLFRLGGGTLEIPTGEVALSAGLEGLAFGAETRVEGTAPRELVARATATNTTRHPIHVEWGACSLEVRAYRDPERTGRPVWRSELRAPPGGEFAYACPAYLATGTIEPGRQFAPDEFILRVPLHEILGDSLPDGRYHFGAALRINFRRTEEFAAGSANLASRRDPLPAERTVDGVRYRVRAERAPDPAAALRLSLTLTNTTDRPREVGGSRSLDCPVSLAAYRTAGERDAWYMGGRPLWSGRECPLRVPPVRLMPGESRTLRSVVDTPGLRGPAHLLAFVWMEGERYPQRIVLPAGEITG